MAAIYTVQIKHASRNVKSTTKILAESADQAIEMAKNETQRCLMNFLRKKTFPAFFWNGADITCTVVSSPAIINSEFDRMSSDCGFAWAD